MISFTIENKNKNLIGREAVKLTQLCSTIKSEIYLNKDGRRINLKSILGLLSADIKPNTIINIEIDSNNDILVNEAKEKLINFFNEEF